MFVNETLFFGGGGTRWRSWLRHCATIRKVAGSITDGVIGIFPSGRPMTLGSTQPLTEMSTRYISWGVKRPVHTADSLTTFVCRLSWNLGASSYRNPQVLSRPVMGLLYHLSAGLLAQKLSIVLEKVFSELPFCTRQYLIFFTNLHLRAHKVSQRNPFSNPTLPCSWWGELNSMKASPADICILSARLHSPLSASLVIPSRCSCY